MITKATENSINFLKDHIISEENIYSPKGRQISSFKIYIYIRSYLDQKYLNRGIGRVLHLSNYIYGNQKAIFKEAKLLPWSVCQTNCGLCFVSFSFLLFSLIFFLYSFLFIYIFLLFALHEMILKIYFC